ncbi:MAG: carbohydrate-binding domain-containing protein [Oscillospiraceae bacterium]|nr:carbohydrate-binding domain-containing protein [Oscillospiraceae bacterium]
MKKSVKIILAGALALFMLVGCGAAPATSAETPAVSSAAETAQSTELTASAVEDAVSKRDASGEYDAAEAVALSPDGDLTITAAGVYVLSGSYEGMIVVEAGEEDKVQLVLDNAELTNDDGPAIYVKSADKVFLTAAEGTVNTISDGKDYTLTDEDTTLDAAVFSEEDLTINGAGSLTISGNNKHAVVSKDDLVVTAKDLTVTAANVGLDGKDSVTLSEATVSITAGSDGLRSENGTDEDKGFVYVLDSKLTVVSGKDGIQAETIFIAENAEISITAGGGSGARSSDASESYKGIKAGVSITVSGGSYQIDALDDAIHTNGSVLISGGDFTLTSRDDGVHANEKIEISGGSLDITAYEGIEATYVLISGGEITIEASDDGINAARKSSAYTPTVEISGGTVTITMGPGDTDGVDSNGNIIISGGTVSVSGQSAFDYDGSGSLTGGTVTVNGQQVTTLPNQMMGGPGGMGGGFGGGMGGGPGGFGGGPGGRH